MRLRPVIATPLLAFLAAGLVRCVGDDPVIGQTPDGVDAASPFDASADVSETSVPDSALPPPPPAVGTFRWANHVGSTPEGAAAVAIDKDGNTVIVFRIIAPMTFPLGDGGTTSLTPNANDVAVLKLDTQGRVIWARSFGGAGGESVSDVAVDATGGIYVAGSTQGFTFGTPPVAVGSGSIGVGYVVKYGPDGAEAWGSTFGNAQTTISSCLSVAARASTVVVGCNFGGSVTYAGQGGPVTVMPVGARDMLISKLDVTSGKSAWATAVGGSAMDDLTGIALDETADNVWFTGTSASQDALVGLGAPPKRVGTVANVLVAKLLTANGGATFSAQYGAPTGNPALTARKIAVNAGVVAVTGFYDGANVDLGLGPLGGGLGSDAFLFAIDAASKKTVFAKSIGSSLNETAGGVVVDQYGRITMIGTYFSTGVTIDGAPLPNPTPPAAEGAFVAKFDRTGAKLWIKGIIGTMGGDAIDGNVLAVGPNAELVGGGLLQNGADLGSGTRVPSTMPFESDAFIVGWAQ